MGQVLESQENVAIVQVFEGTRGLDTDKTRVRFSGDIMRIPLSKEILGRSFDGLGRPIDGGPAVRPLTRQQGHTRMNLSKPAFPLLMG